ncbi:MAG: SPOR domain-containing protein [Nitrospinae bacterium]|nr:SPOR domain-containing protein [Nitrospinota bacterium]
MGAFLEKDNAESFAEDLKNKGYAPYIVSIGDSMKRQWHTVRLGDYDTQEEAAKAAGEFAKKERMTASIRGVGAL